MAKLRLSAIVGVFTLAVALVFSLPAAAADDPFTGTWKLNLAKSKLQPPLPKSQTVTIQVSGNAIRVREEVVAEDGQTMVVTVDAKFDGKDYPINGSPVADQVAYQRVSARTIKGTAKKAGKIVVREMATVSRDGKTLTGSYSGTDAEGKKISGTAVFDKQ